MNSSVTASKPNNTQINESDWRGLCHVSGSLLKTNSSQPLKYSILITEDKEKRVSGHSTKFLALLYSHDFVMSQRSGNSHIGVEQGNRMSDVSLTTQRFL